MKDIEKPENSSEQPLVKAQKKAARRAAFIQEIAEAVAQKLTIGQTELPSYGRHRLNAGELARGLSRRHTPQ
jgi:hypothetical protein